MREGITVDLKGMEDVMAMLDTMDPEGVKRAMHEGLSRALEKIEAAAQNECPRDNGALKNSIKYRIKIGNGEMVGEVYSNKEYAVYVEMGTGPKGEANHEGVNPEWLKEVTYNPKGWFVPKKGEDGKDEGFFTEGYRARPFLYPAFKSQQGNVYKEITRAFQNELRRRSE